MDHSQRLIEFLSADKAPRQIFLAPHAPPVNRRGGNVEVAMDMVLDGADVEETLLGLRNFVRRRAGGALVGSDSGELPLDRAGTFSISVSGLGRFRISYMTQRGSFAASVTRIPTAMASFDSLFSDPDAFDRVMRIANTRGGGLIVIFGTNPAWSSTLAYGVLQRVNATERRSIHTIERHLSFLIRHDNSVITQAEIGVDAPSMETAIGEALALAPDLLYIGDLQATDDVPSLARAAESETLTIVSAVASSRDSFLCTVRECVGGLVDVVVPRIRCLVRTTSDAAGWIGLDLMDASTAAK